MAFRTELVGSAVEMLVLNLLTQRAMYGYEIIQTVNERTNGEFDWKEGTLYPVLHRLESAGYLASEWQVGDDSGKDRKYYKPTAKGRKHAAARAEEWKKFAKSVNAALVRAGA